MNTLDTLIKARKMIEKPEHWCQGDYALDGRGAEVDTNDEAAARFCMNGALARAAGVSVSRIERGEIMASLRPFLIGENLHFSHSFNDTHTHAEVLAAFDKAIATERAKFEAQFLNPQHTLKDCTEPSSPRIEAVLVP